MIRKTVLGIQLVLLCPTVTYAFNLDPGSARLIQDSQLIVGVVVTAAGEPATVQIRENFKGITKEGTIKVRNVRRHTEDPGFQFEPRQELILFLDLDTQSGEYTSPFGSFGIKRTLPGLATAVRLFDRKGSERTGLLVQLLRGPDPEQTLGLEIARYLRASPMGLVGEKSMNDAIITMLNSPNRDVRRDAAYVLGQLNAKEAVPPLIELVEDHDAAVSDTALHSLRIITKQHQMVDARAGLSGEEKRAVAAKWRRWYQEGSQALGE